MKNKREIIESKYPPRNNEDIWLKDLLLYASTTKGWLPLGSEKTYSNKTELLKDTPAGGTIGIDKETGTAYLYNDVSKKWTPIGGGGGGMTEVTYSELSSKRDAGKLTPGALYRITDYNCTTTQKNTQSAGHQFDIVLLALSANKLAEEGWAMMHDNIYDVTFDDGVTKKCWIYDNGNNPMAKYNIVDAVTLKGLVISMHTIEIDEEHKTAVVDSYYSDDLEDEGLTYDYFQNSNLSAWKVWYCLDNDKSRFAWADNTYKLNPASIICDCYRAGNEKVDGPIDYSGKQFVNGTIYYRDEENDTTIPYMGNMPVYAWTSENNITIFTESVSPNSFSGTYTYNNRGDISYISGDAGIIYKTTSYVEGLPNYDFPNGRGVIYRLIDEFNNDVCYDFKNIQYVRPMTEGDYDPDHGEDTWVYTFTRVNATSLEIEDSTLDESVNCKIEINPIFGLSNNVFFNSAISCKIDCKSSGLTIQSLISITIISSYDMDIIEDVAAIYINNKKVLTEE